ncbi:MAG: hypothetical protein QXX64_03155 [Nitrososphaera sp.]
MIRKELLAAFLAAALISSVLVVSWVSTTFAQTNGGNTSATDTAAEEGEMTEEEHDESMNTTVVRDSVFIRGPVTLAPQDFLHLYDTTPYMIMNGHVAIRTTCDADAEPNLQILIGQAPDLKPAELEYIADLSTPGKICLYHADLESEHDVEGGIITDIALFNPNSVPTRLPWHGGSVVIGINEIMPLEGDHHGEHGEEEEAEHSGNMTGNMTG